MCSDIWSCPAPFGSCWLSYSAAAGNEQKCWVYHTASMVKCSSNCTARLFQWLTLAEFWFHFCSCKSGNCICLTNCGCGFSWIDCGVFVSNHTSVVMKSCFTILFKGTHSAELFTGIRNCLFRAKGFFSSRQWWRFSWLFTSTTSTKQLWGKSAWSPGHQYTAYL